jgi:hypothetical protein
MICRAILRNCKLKTVAGFWPDHKSLLHQRSGANMARHTISFVVAFLFLVMLGVRAADTPADADMLCKEENQENYE